MAHGSEPARPTIGPADRGRFWAVVPAGGSGTRLWPLSRAARPKFLLPLLGPALAAPADRRPAGAGRAAGADPGRLRRRPTPPPSPASCRSCRRRTSSSSRRPKGSGPAIGLAAALIARRDPEAVMGSFAADHDVQDEAAFAPGRRAPPIAAARARLAGHDRARRRPAPETGYGYIERTDEVVVATGGRAAYRAARFHEKPDLARAEEYVACGRFLWNASMFVWRVQTLLDELRRLQPELHAGLMRIAAALGRARPRAGAGRGLGRAGREHDRPGGHGARRPGRGRAGGDGLVGRRRLARSGRADRERRARQQRPRRLLQVERHATASSGRRPARVVALVGLDNVVVVDTPDALLVADRSRAQEVRKVVDHLKAAAARRVEVTWSREIGSGTTNRTNH